MGKKKGGNKKGKVVSKKQVEKIARQTAYAMLPKKLHYFEGVDFGPGTISNTTPWVMIEPTFIDYSLTNEKRMSDQIFVEKCSGFFNISFNPATTNRVEVRELVGFYKGTSDATQKNIADFSVTTLANLLPNKMSTWDRDNFYIKHDKSYDIMPQQVYNAGHGDGSNVPNGIWRSRRIPLTHHLYRKYRYSNTTEGGDGNTVEGTIAASNHVVGWKPFIALQIRCPDQNFTASTGTNPGPYIDYKFKTEFKDMV